MTSHFHETPSSFDLRATLLLAKRIHLRAMHKKHLVLGVCGGRSVSRIYDLLARQPLPWERIHIFLIDEIIALDTSPGTNTALVHQHLVLPLLKGSAFPAHHFHSPLQHRILRDGGASHYTQDLAALGGEIDILLCSSGEDGHVGALYPNHKLLTSRKQSYLSLHDCPKPPKDRITISPRLFLAADTAIVIFLGNSKRDPYSRFTDSSLDVRDCPAKLVSRVRHGFAVTAFS